MYKELQKNNNFVYAHTSGHANLDALQKFASSLKPKKLIPIHTEFKEEFTRYFDNVSVLDDDETMEIK
ncbi:MAG: MBL fold metallo-hydrolase RNA specificity domain-containing protein [Campylobacterota bacterium]|nr:MBL fold metallo-hydrolase RNA specificity domain-containing protein [Campylobacterota bacterium]